MSRRYNPFYDKKQILRCLGMFVLMIVAMKLTSGVGFAVIIPFAFMALTQNRPAMFLFYIMLSISGVIINGTVATKDAAFFIEQRAMMCVFGVLLATRVAGQQNSPVVKPFLVMMAYLFYMVIPSVLGWYPPISIMKLFLFGIIYLSFYGAANLAATSSRSGLREVRSVVLAIIIPFIIGSALLIPFPAISMMSYEEMLLDPNLSSLFKGMTTHSQCLGPIVACAGTLVLADLLFGVRRPDKLYLVLLACCPILIWKTSSRTAMGSMLAGGMFVVYFFAKSRGVARGWKQKVMNASFVLFILATVMLVGAAGRVKQFIVKRGYKEGESINTEEVVSGRLALSNAQYANFEKSPLFGNGFQVSEEMKYRFTGPWYKTLSAPIEKGVWVTAVLEEGGAFGMAIFLLFVGGVFSTLLKRHAYIGASTFFVFLVSNMGEFTLFSMSYAGGFVWSIVFAGVALDAARVRDERLRQKTVFMPPGFIPLGR